MDIQQWKNSREARKKNNLIIIGGGGHGKVCAEIAYLMQQWDEIYFLDDQYIPTTAQYQWLGRWCDLPNHYHSSSEFFIAVGDQALRKKLVQSIPRRYSRYVTLIHPSAIISPDVSIRLGTVVMAGVVINNEVNIGWHTILNTSCSVDHGCVVGSYSHLSPGARLCGNVVLEDEVWLGAGGIVLPNCRIYRDCLIGAASLVTKDIVDPGIYTGIPCRRIEGLESNN